MAKKLAIGMTVGLRRNKGVIYDYAEQAAFSLRHAGFSQELHCFVEPGADIHMSRPKRWKAVIHQNEKNLGCFPNFRHGLKYLIENTDADFLLMLQDDCIWRIDGAARIQATINDAKYADAGFLSPYTSKAMVAKDKREPASRWENRDAWLPCRFHNNAFWGAVALLFPRRSAKLLEETSQRYRNHNHHRKLDVVVGNAIRVELELPIYVHAPSLCDHIGSWSTLGRHRFKGNKWGRRGFLFRNK